MLLRKGKKTNSENIFKNILINLKKITKQKPNFILIKSIKNLLPKLKAISIPNKKKK
jgi:ribosomal protein S7